MEPETDVWAELAKRGRVILEYTPIDQSCDAYSIKMKPNFTVWAGEYAARGDRAREDAKAMADA